MTRVRFIYRNGGFWFRSTDTDIGSRGPVVRHYQSGPFATLEAAWAARFET
ncbi:hypothetical protein [Brevundimonas sp.]|uniref:hypothetical protein n=1 Tax=Brevundimonas sp. TaxID=1871086 RepID=UPI0025BAF7F5|nr:hypothetical protein [Brevundimonas sp.]